MECICRFRIHFRFGYALDVNKSVPSDYFERAIIGFLPDKNPMGKVKHFVHRAKK